jgi:putative DNA-invertase from lambdoid prophage Rac
MSFVWTDVKAAIYCRVSMDDQTNDPQRGELRAEAQRRGWTVAAEIQDTISGTKRSRTGLDALMKLVRAKSIDAVMVYKLDRLGRSLPHLVQLIGEFDSHGVALVCTSQGLDTSDANPAGRLVAHILMAIAQFERALISDRTKMGMKMAKANGSKIGRKPAALPANAAEILAEWKNDSAPASTTKAATSPNEGCRCPPRTQFSTWGETSQTAPQPPPLLTSQRARARRLHWHAPATFSLRHASHATDPPSTQLFSVQSKPAHR